MHQGPHAVPLTLSSVDRATLVARTRRRTTAQALGLRASCSRRRTVPERPKPSWPPCSTWIGHRSTYELEQVIRRYMAAANTAARPFVWTKTADEILESVARFCNRTSNCHH